MNFSDRTRWENHPNLLTRTFADLLSAGERILNLTESNPTHCGFRYLSPDLLKPFADAGNLLYEPDPHGLLPAREAVAGYYQQKGISVAPGDLFLTASTSEAYGFLFRLLANAGDAVLAPQPSYPLLDYLGALNDVSIGRYRITFEKEKWKTGFSRFDEGPAKNRALVLVHPNNPTGNFIKEEERREINRRALSRQWALIVDEVFADFALGQIPEAVPSFASNQDVLTFTLGGISKILGLPQMKLSWIAVSGPQDLKQEAISRLEVIADTYLSANTPVQRAMPQWFAAQPAIRQEIKARLVANYGYLQQKISGQEKIKLLPTEGGWYAVLELPESSDDETYAVELLKRQKVFVHPGYFFDFPEGTFLVISLLPQENDFREGVDRIRCHSEGPGH